MPAAAKGFRDMADKFAASMKGRDRAGRHLRPGACANATRSARAAARSDPRTPTPRPKRAASTTTAPLQRVRARRCRCSRWPLLTLLPIVEIVLRRFDSGIPGGTPFVQHLTLVVALLGGALAARDDRLLALATGSLLPAGPARPSPPRPSPDSSAPPWRACSRAPASTWCGSNARPAATSPRACRCGRSRCCCRSVSR